MKAITLWQPWASLLACGAKIYETRSWATNYRGPIAIHAAAKHPYHCIGGMIGEATDAMVNVLSPIALNALPLGCIIATAELVGCWEMKRNPIDKVVYFLNETDAAVCIEGDELLFGDWTPGRYAWEFANMTMLPEPIPAKGGQRLWNWAQEGKT